MALRLYSVAALLFIALVVVCRGDDAESESPEEAISVEVLTPAPEDCERKSKRNDMLSMHYVGTLTESGKKFDAR